MALKFLNKKGWHTGSLRNIENVWKAEQKHDAEQRKLEELRKQIQEERERSEFRLLQEQAGLVPHQERLDFLYDSGLAVGKGSSDGFKALESLPVPQNEASSSSKPSVPGALFEEKPQSANDAWRKLHSDPLLMIRQKEQEALARIKNNPVKMAMIRKSVEVKKHNDAAGDNEQKVRSKHKDRDDDNAYQKKVRSKHRDRDDDDAYQKVRSKHRDRDDDDDAVYQKKVRSKHRDVDDVDNKIRYKHRDEDIDHRSKHNDGADDKIHKKVRSEHRSHTSSKNRSDKEDQNIEGYRSSRGKRDDDDDDDIDERTSLRHRDSDVDLRSEKQLERSRVDHRTENVPSREQRKRYDEKSKHEKPQDECLMKNSVGKEGNDGKPPLPSDCNYSATVSGHHKYRNAAPKLSEEERAARLREMQVDAQLHEEQRWKRLKKADEDEAQEARQAVTSSGKSFLDDANKRVYGAEKGGSSTIEESVRRRRMYFHQDRSQSDERNAFRR